MAHASLPNTHDEDMLDSLTIGRRVRQLRTERGMTLDDLGAAIGRAASQVSVIENGKREPKLSELQRLARALGVTIDQLISTEAPTGRAALASLQTAPTPPMPARMPGVDRATPLGQVMAEAGRTAIQTPAVQPSATGRDVVTGAAAALPTAAALAGGALTSAEAAFLNDLRAKTDGAEVICIVRSHNDPRAKSEIIVLDRASPEFLEQLTAEQSVQKARYLTSARLPKPQKPASASRHPPVSRR